MKNISVTKIFYTLNLRCFSVGTPGKKSYLYGFSKAPYTTLFGSTTNPSQIGTSTEWQLFIVGKYAGADTLPYI